MLAFYPGPRHPPVHPPAGDDKGRFARARSAALAAGILLALFLGAGEASAAAVCSNTPGANDWIDCSTASAADLSITTSNVVISTTGSSTHGVYLRNIKATWAEGESADITLGMTGGSVSTTGGSAYGVYVRMADFDSVGDITVDLTNVDVELTGSSARGVYTYFRGDGAQAIRMSGGSITTTGRYADGIYAVHVGETTGKLTIDLSGGLSIKVRDYGIYTNESASGGTAVTLSDVSIESSGFTVVYAGRNGQVTDDGAKGDLVITLTDATITAAASNMFGRGVSGVDSGAGDILVNFESGRIRTGGASGDAMDLEQGFDYNSPTGRIENSGAWADDVGEGSITATIGAEAALESPFSIGVRSRTGNPKVGTGRIVITHEGGIRAGKAGIFAWAARYSGSTFGDGHEATADDAARTAPMIHVTSSGDITVGRSVTDDFVRSVVAGADGTLSAAERSVLDALEAEDEDALDAAIDALPADYADAYKADVRGLLASLTDDQTQSVSSTVRGLAESEEILGLPAAGIRALALSHTRIGRYVRVGDQDPALLAISSWRRTTEQRATLREQGAFSDREREVMLAVMAGGEGLEALLAALPAVYSDAWKDEVRRYARLYNEGDVRVDVTGGTIVSEGDGAQARYIVRHDRNGEIVLTVAQGASVTGGRHGIYVSGGGAGEGNSRAQSVSIDGMVTGGTGAGVHVEGGGRLTVGATGSVGADSGVGVLADGPGDFHATVAGTVEGDVRSMGSGAFTADISGMVTGDLRGMGDGDVTATVSGTVDGDVQAAGGALTAEVMEGGVVTGTIHDPAAPMTIAGSVGRVLLTNGGEVTVASTGALTGVDGEAIRGEAGDLSVTIAGMATGDVLSEGDLTATISGTLTGDVRGMAALTAVISGMVDGDVEGLGDAEHAVTLSTGSVVTGEIHLAASTVYVDGTVRDVRLDRGGTLTIGPNGRILAREGVAVRNERGALAVTIEAAPGERPGESAARVGGTIESADADALTVTLVSASGRIVELELDDEGRILTGPPPHAKVYEALPSVLLGMSRPLTHAERTGAPRSPRGGWARIEGASGDWKATSSTTGAAYELKRHGVRAGFDVSVDANLLLGFSVHHVRGSADVAGGGEIEVRGSGAGVSAAYAFGGGFYLDGQVEATFYAADMDSDLQGRLKTGASASALSMGAEIGKRMRFKRGTLTPRARLVRASISMNRFTDELDGRAAIKDADSLKGSLGLLAEAVRGSVGGGEFALRGSLDVEREFSPETAAKLDGDSLEAEAEKTRVLVGLGARWRRGDFSIGGEISAHGLGSDHESLGGRLTLGWRF